MHPIGDVFVIIPVVSCATDEYYRLMSDTRARYQMAAASLGTVPMALHQQRLLYKNSSIYVNIDSDFQSPRPLLRFYGLYVSIPIYITLPCT